MKNLRKSEVLSKADRGSSLLITLLALAIGMALGMALVTHAVSDLGVSSNYRNKATAFYAADTGLEVSMVDLMADNTWIDEVVDTDTWTAEDPFPTTVTINGMVVTLDVDGGGQVVPQYYPLGTAGSIGNGSFTRQIFMPPTVVPVFDDAKVTFTIRSSGAGGLDELASQVVRADLILDVDDYSVWDNAIFAGEGAAGNVINGNVSIRGGMHVVGDPLSPPTIDFSGTADLRNNYADAVDHFGLVDAAKLPPIKSEEFDGVMVDTLEAVVRLANGEIVLDGTSDIGEANDNGNTYKETVDAVRADGPVGPAGQVYTDKWRSYDTTGVTMPSLDDPYLDKSTMILWPSHRDYLDNNSLTIAVNEISTNTNSFNVSNAYGSIKWNKATSRLDIDGIVKVVGDLTLGKAAGPSLDRGFNYDGTGTLYATNDVIVNGHIVPVGGYITDGNMGIIADNNMSIDRTAQINIMAALFAEGAVSVQKQTSIAGALVANYFDMGTNVPAIFHVPALPANLPPGMPGGDDLLIVEDSDIANWYQEQ